MGVGMPLSIILNLPPSSLLSKALSPSHQLLPKRYMLCVQYSWRTFDKKLNNEKRGLGQKNIPTHIATSRCIEKHVSTCRMRIHIKFQSANTRQFSVSLARRHVLYALKRNFIVINITSHCKPPNDNSYRAIFYTTRAVRSIKPIFEFPKQCYSRSTPKNHFSFPTHLTSPLDIWYDRSSHKSTKPFWQKTKKSLNYRRTSFRLSYCVYTCPVKLLCSILLILAWIPL